MEKKIETRIIPEETDRSFFLQHFKVYTFVNEQAEGKQVLDAGCGDGYGSAYLAKKARFVYGIDYEEEVVARAKDKYQAGNLKYLPMDALDLEFNDREFDIICSFQVIEHIPEELIPKYLGQLKRALKDTGTLYLSTLNLAKAIKSQVTYKKNPAHCKEFRLQELRDTLAAAFDRVTIYGLHRSPRYRVFLRIKKIGIFKFLPEAIDPVKIFFRKIIGVNDFRLTDDNLENASDFLCVCKK